MAAQNDPGTCQGCFKDQKTRDGRLVLHGYKRPGHGYILGNCWGHGYAPYQISCERTKQFLDECVRPALPRALQALDRLQAKPESVSYEANVYVGWENTPGVRGAGRAGYLTKFFKVERGEEDSYRLFEGMTSKSTRASQTTGAVNKSFKARYGRELEDGEITAFVPSYERVLAGLIRQTEQEISAIRDHIKFLDQKVAEWKPVPWPAIKAVA